MADKEHLMMLLRGHYCPPEEQGTALAAFLQSAAESDLEQIAHCLTELLKHFGLKPQALRTGVSTADQILSLMELSLGFDSRSPTGPASSSAELARPRQLWFLRQAMQRALAKTQKERQERKAARSLDSSTCAKQMDELLRAALSEEGGIADCHPEQAREEDPLQTALLDTLALCGFVDFCAEADEHLSGAPKGRNKKEMEAANKVIDKLRGLPQKVRAKRLRVMTSSDDAQKTAEAWHQEAEKRLHDALLDLKSKAPIDAKGAKRPRKVAHTKANAAEEIWKILNECLQD
jgi:hypothetical protein